MSDEHTKNGATPLTRRRLLGGLLRAAGVLGLGGLLGALRGKAGADTLVWQIDPHKCNQCGLCATACVLPESAVKCVHSYAICGYCDLCTGYLEQDATARDTGAENQLCPTNAIKRTYIEDPYFAYTIDEKRCIACGKCVKGCTLFGNGSLYLQVRHDRCLNCNSCTIARVCPAAAFVRVPAERPYILKDNEGGGLDA